MSHLMQCVTDVVRAFTENALVTTIMLSGVGIAIAVIVHELLYWHKRDSLQAQRMERPVVITHKPLSEEDRRKIEAVWTKVNIEHLNRHLASKRPPVQEFIHNGKPARVKRR
jgi:hypothetical protein